MRADDDLVVAEAAADVNALTEQGLLRILRGDRDGALPLLERAVELGSRDPAILIELARIYRLQSRPRDVIRLLAPVVDLANEPAAWQELTRAQLDAGEYRTALEQSTRLIESLDLSAIKAHELPMLLDVYEVAAEAARGTGDSIRASVLYGTLQSVLLRHNRRDLADQARRQEERHVRAFASRVIQTAPVEEAVPDYRFGDLLTEAHRQLDQGHVFAALDASYDALALESMSLRPFIDIAAGYAAADQAVAAATLLRSVEAVARLREPSADLAPAQRLLGRITGDMQRREQAVARWLADGDRVAAAAELRDMAAEAARATQWSRAEALYRRVMENDAGRASDALALAQTLDRQGNSQEALAELRAASERLGASGRPDASLPFWATAVTQTPEMPEVRQEYGEALLRQGRPAEGAQELIWAADIAGRQGKDLAVGCLLRAAQVYDEMDDLATALRTYDRLMRQAPGDAQVQEHFVGFCLRRGRPDLAAKTLRTLTEFLLNRPDGASPAAAIAALTQLMVLVPDDAWAYEQLAAILAGEGRRQESLNVYRQLASRRPDDAAVAERLRELSSSVGSAPSDPATGG